MVEITVTNSDEFTYIPFSFLMNLDCNNFFGFRVCALWSAQCNSLSVSLRTTLLSQTKNAARGYLGLPTPKPRRDQ
jgi:hypothetical protein